MGEGLGAGAGLGEGVGGIVGEGAGAWFTRGAPDGPAAAYAPAELSVTNATASTFVIIFERSSGVRIDIFSSSLAGSKMRRAAIAPCTSARA